MSFFRKLSLRSQLLLLVVCIVLAGFALTLSVLTHRMTQVQQETALQQVEELAGRYSLLAAEPLQRALETARTMGAAFIAMKETGMADRQTGNAMLRAILENNPGLVSAWTVWEPNAFDGRDALFERSEGHDASGRYVPALIRSASGGTAIAPVADYDTPGVGDYYQLPKASGQETLLEPFKYNLGDREILQTAIAVPIRIDGRFVGVAGVGVALSSLQELVQSISVYDTGYASLVSNQAIYVGDRDPANVGQKLGSDLPASLADRLRAGAGNGAPLRDIFTDPRLDQSEATVLQLPVAIGSLSTPWSFLAVVPTARIQAEVRTLQWLAAGLGLLSIALTSIGLAIAINRLVLRPLGGEPAAAAALAERVAHGDLSGTIKVTAGDTNSLMFQLRQMQDSLAALVAQVREGAQAVATASAQISTGNQDLSNRTESQASALEETAASMEELGATVRQNADHAHTASMLAQEASGIVERGGASVSQVVQSMQGISASSRKIADIIGVIDSIAFQTNILALNAAVEAARAGEQGRGFAVVAGEVRSLAQRSADAAKEIKTLIGTSVEQVDIGSQQVDEAGATMTQVVEAIERVSTIVHEISAASSEQSSGVTQVGQAVTQMDQDTQQNAALVEEMSAAASSLRQQADTLVATVSVFRLAEHSATTRQHSTYPALPH